MNSLRLLSSVSVLAAALASQSAWADAPAKITFQDQVLPIFKNACVNCHNPDKKKAGLDLSTYQATLAGSDNGKIVESGNSAASLLVKCCKQTEEPRMPPKGDKLSEGDIAMLEKWIAGQLLETATGKAVVASNKVETAVVSLARPEGPAPMPTADLPLEPFVQAKGSNALVALAASPWAPLVAVGGQKQIILYQTETLEPLGILPFPEGFPSVIRFSRNGKLLMTGGGLGGKSGKVVLWDVQTGERAGEVGNEFDQVLGADLSPDQGSVALGGPGKVLKIFSTKDGKLLHTIKKHTDWITAVAYSPDGKYLASADRNGGICVWEGATGQEFVTLAGHKAAVTALAFMPGVLASASEDGKITLWDVKDGKEIRSWAGHNGGVSSVDFTPDGRLVSAGRDKLAKAWDQTGKALLTSEPFQDIALRAVLAEDRVIAGDWSGKIRVFNLKDGGKAQGELTSNPQPIAAAMAEATRLMAEAQAAQAAATQGVAAAEGALKAALEANKQRLAAGKAEAEAGLKQAQAELDGAKSGPAAFETLLGETRAALAKAEVALAGAAEPEKAAVQKQQEELKVRIGEQEAKLAEAKKGQPALVAAAEKRQQESVALLAKAEEALKGSDKLPSNAEAEAQVTEGQKALDGLKANAAAVQAKRDALKAGTPEYAAEDARLNRRNAAVATAQAGLEKAKASLTSSAVEQEPAKQRAALDAANAKVAAQRLVVARWERAQAFMQVHNSRQTLADLQAQMEATQATVKDALSPIAKAEGDIAFAEKTLKELPALIKERESTYAAVRAAGESAAKAATSLETLLVEKETQKKGAAEAEKKATAELPAVTKRNMTAKSAMEKQTSAGDKPEPGSPQAAALEEKTKVLQTELEQSQQAVDAGNKAIADAKAATEKLTAEVTKTKEELSAARLEAKKKGAEQTKAEAALVAAKQSGEDARKLLAETKPKMSEIAAGARATKAKAEKDVERLAREVQEAKGKSERVKAEYDTRYRTASAPAPGGTPLAAQ